MKAAGITTIFLIGFSLHLFLLGKVEEARKGMTHLERSGYVLPPEVLRLTSIGFKGLVADSLFLKASTFFGGKDFSDITKEDWNWMYKTLDAATIVNPYLLAPYYFGQAVLPWEAGMVNEANLLLERGTKTRDWDWMLPYFIGFNHFYFLMENEKAAQYLMEASGRPGAWTFIPRLAARLRLEGGRTETTIAFLQEISKKTEDIGIKKRYEIKIETLQRILFLEKAAELYKERFGSPPADLEDMVRKGIIPAIPKDPYGGEFYLDTDGEIKTSSRFRPVRRRG